MTRGRRYAGLATGAVAGALALAAVGCGGSDGGGSTASAGSGEGKAQPGGKVRMRLWAEVNALDPHKTDNAAAYQLTEFLYDRIVTVNRGVVQAGLATRWEATPRQIVFTIDDGVTCSDGTSVTPSTIKSSFERVVDPKTNNAVAADFLGDDVRFAADDAAGTFTVTLGRANSDLLVNLAEPSFSVVCPAGLKNPERLQSESFGSGPYTLKQAVRGSGYTLERRDGYAWAPGRADVSALPDEVELKVVANETTAANLMLSGGLDMMVAEKAANAARLDGKGYVKKDSAVGLAFLMFNETPGRVTEDQAVRTAIAHLVDPADYAAATQGTLGTPSPGDLFPSVTSCGPETAGENATRGAELRPATDPAAAAAALEEAGWTKSGGTWTKDGKPLSVRIHSHDNVGQSGDYVAQVLKDFGIGVEVKMTTVDRYVEDAQKNEWDVYAASLAASSSPSVIGVVFGGGGLDWGAIRNEAFSSEVSAARAAATPDESCEHWREAQNALFERVDVVPEAFINSAFFGDGVTFDVWSSGLIEPTSLKRVG